MKFNQSFSVAGLFFATRSATCTNLFSFTYSEISGLILSVSIAYKSKMFIISFDVSDNPFIILYSISSLGLFFSRFQFQKDI